MENEHISPRIWTLIGQTSAGHNVYRSILGSYAVDRGDGLVPMTDDEMNGILMGDGRSK